VKVAVLGSGGLGGYFGALLARAGQDVTFIARGKHLQALREKGWQVHSVNGDFTVQPTQATDRPEEIGQVDLVLFAVKTYHIDEALRSLPPLVGPATTVLTTQNGVDAADRAAAAVGPQAVLPGAVWIVSEVESPGVIRQLSPFRRIAFGERDGRISARAQAILEALQLAGAQAEISPDILKTIWTKYLFIASFSGVSSVVRLPAGGVKACPETMDLVRQAMGEVEAVARAKGIALDADVVGKTMAFVNDLGPDTTSSMQRDVAAGRRLEIEALSGTVVRYADELGLPAPAHRFIYAALKPLELWAAGRQAASPA
jgi:2-dehydropantoate 2-reductase